MLKIVHFALETAQFTKIFQHGIQRLPSVEKQRLISFPDDASAPFSGMFLFVGDRFVKIGEGFAVLFYG